MTIDLSIAVQTAFITALSVPELIDIEVPDLTDGTEVTQHVEQLSEGEPHRPLVKVGDILLEPIGGKDGGLDQATVEIITEVREPTRIGLSARMNLVRELLDGVALVAPAGVILSEPVFEGQSGDLLEDGQTYQGTQTFSLFVQAE